MSPLTSHSMDWLINTVNDWFIARQSTIHLIQLVLCALCVKCYNECRKKGYRTSKRYKNIILKYYQVIQSIRHLENHNPQDHRPTVHSPISIIKNVVVFRFSFFLFYLFAKARKSFVINLPGFVTSFWLLTGKWQRRQDKRLTINRNYYQQMHNNICIIKYKYEYIQITARRENLKLQHLH